MEITNYSKLVKPDDKKDLINLNVFAPTWEGGGFRMLCIGPSGCGKTNTILDLLLNHIYYDRIYIYCKDPYEDYYNFLDGVLKVSKEKKILKDYVITENLDNNILFDNLEENKDDQTLIIFDDFINESIKEHQPINKLFTQGRKKTCSMIYISQSFFDIPSKMRKNSNYLMVYKLEDDREAKDMLKRYSQENIDKVFNLYKEATKEQHCFFLIDKQTINDVLKFRKNWDNLIL